MATTQRLILASASEGRQHLLRRAGYRFEVIPSHVDEPDPAGFPSVRAYVQQVAWLKAAAVAARVESGLILAADSIAWLNGRGIGKPVDEADARRILQTLSGAHHELWTGVCLWMRPSDRQIAWQEASIVEMKALSATELEAYLASCAWQGKSGAYAIQEDGDPFIQVVKGTVSNVVGLPMESLVQALDWIQGKGIQ